MCKLEDDRSEKEREMTDYEVRKRSQPWVPMVNTASSQFPAPLHLRPTFAPDAGRYRTSASNSNSNTSGSGCTAEILIPGASLLPQGQRLGQDAPRLIPGDIIM